MKSKISVDDAKKLLMKYVHDEFLLRHSEETEAIMIALAEYFGEDKELWGVTGLLHDLDYEQTKNCPENHGLRTCEILKDEGYDIPSMFHAIKAHTEKLGFLDVKRESRLDFCLSAAESITGLIFAYSLMRPNKSLEGASVKSLTKKFKDKSFAAKVNRELISDIEKAGLSRYEFFEISLKAISDLKQ